MSKFSFTKEGKVENINDILKKVNEFCKNEYTGSVWLIGQNKDKKDEYIQHE